MTLKGKQRIVVRHPFPVAGDAQEAASPRFRIDMDAPRACIDRILDQLLDDRRRTLDDLARRDLVSQLIRENVDFGHRRKGAEGQGSVKTCFADPRPLKGKLSDDRKSPD